MKCIRSMRANSDLIASSAQGHDKSLSQNGDDRYYWYNIRDMMTLLGRARNVHLTYRNYDRLSILRDRYLPLKPNDQQSSVMDPYHGAKFADYFSADIDKIIGNGGEYTQCVRKSMPHQIIIPIVSGGYWRSIIVQVDYVKEIVSVLWDDPCGKGYFPQSLKDICLEAMIPNINRLIVKAVGGHSEFKVSVDKIVQVDKSLDQQGKGSNAWDCGPIIMSNIIDYIRRSGFMNPSFEKYSICAISNAAHEKQVIETRLTHRVQYCQQSNECLDTNRLRSITEEESRIAAGYIYQLEQSTHPYQQLIAELSPSQVNILFALIESQRNPQGERSCAYSEQEVKRALEHIHRQPTPLSLDTDKLLDVTSINAMLEQMNSNVHQLSFAIDTNDFAKITAQGRSFVDKSLFVKDIIETRDHFTMITRPRRWGKTTNLDMLSKFFALKTDDSAVSSYKELFQRLLIGQKYPEFVKQHQGKYPVIYFTFKNITSKVFSTIKSELSIEIQKLYSQYVYLLDSKILDNNDKKDIRKYLSGNMKKMDIEYSLRHLSSLLEEHHKKRVYIFIDDYDAILNATFDTEEYEKAFLLLSSMLGQALNGNNNLKKAVVTGLTNAGISSYLDNVCEYSILDKEYAEYFGFTGAEVHGLLQQANMTDPKISVAISDYYNGYTIGDCNLYNPWSIVRFMDGNRIGNYWVDSEGSMSAADRNLSSGLLTTNQMQATVRGLINNYYAKESMEIVIFPRAELHRLKHSRAAVCAVLAYGGYLSLTNRYMDDDLTETCEARIPNN